MQRSRTVLLFIFTILFFSAIAHAQDSSIVKWIASVNKTAENKYEIILKGSISKGWHLYSTLYEAEGLTGIQLVYNDSTVKAEPSRIIANNTSIPDPVFEKKTIEVATDSISVIQQVSFDKNPAAAVKLILNYYVGSNETFIPEEKRVTVALEAGSVPRVQNRILIPSIDINKPLTDCGKTSSSAATGPKSNGLLNVFWLGFLGGFIALILPCLFPMIPLTVSFFTKKATSKKEGVMNAFLYGFFIFLIYILISLPFHFLEKLNPAILNNISTNVYLNLIFFAVFIFFALSFFGYYEINLPSALSSKADSKAGVGNIIGIFFMALTLAVVSFSCTGPILGSLLAGSLSGDGGAMRLSFGMAGFGLALALPFALFALFPNWLNSLPKSGGWLNTIKVSLGFIELALAFKFLSNADLVMHWNILKREIFIGAWVLIGAGLSLYLFGLIKFKHDSPVKKLSATRLVFAILSSLFTLYLVPGVTNTKWANLSLISGFPPPLYYSIYQQESDCVLGLNCSNDYEEGLKRAKEEHKPVLLDFTGYACVNCRRMEENVWSQPEVYKLMKEKFIVISLYVDDKKKLPAAEQFIYSTKEGIEKDIITVGDKWATFETENFRSNAQPLYAIINHGEQLLTYPVGYVPSAKEYLQWLQCGVDAFEKK